MVRSEGTRHAISRRRTIIATTARQYPEIKGQWQGPYRVLKQVGKIIYKIDIQERGTTKVIFTAIYRNELWHTHEQEKVSQTNIVKESEDFEKYQWEQDPLKFGEQLPEEEWQAVYQLLLKFPTIIAKYPGRTNQAKH